MTTNNAINNLNFPNITSVNTGTVLTASAYGTEVICTGAAAYALTLPTVTSNANKFIDIFSQTTSHAIVTITPASGTIAGQSTLAIGSGDGVRIMNDGTNWWVLNTWLQPVNFSIALSAPQTIATTTLTTVVYDTAIFDIGSFFNTGTGIYTPLMPGKYHITQNTAFVATTATNFILASTIVNNASVAVQSVAVVQTANVILTLNPSIIRSLNGSTDTIIGKVEQTSGSNLNITATATDSTNRIFGLRLSLF